jgi:hypothetical protein
MHRHDHPMPMVRMPEDVVASLDSVELPTAALQGRTASRGVTAGSRGIRPRR